LWPVAAPVKLPESSGGAGPDLRPSQKGQSMVETTVTLVKDTSANPAPLGLFGFGMTTVMLNFHNAGFFEMNSMILAMGICYGGIAQIIAGIMESKKNNTFGMTAFISYGFFWLSLVTLILLPMLNPAFKTDDHGMATYLAIWGLFTFGLFIGTFRLSVALQVVFGSLTILFFMLAVQHLGSVSTGYKHLTGLEGIFCGLSAIYTGIAQVLNEIYGCTILPIGIVKR
jgi:succinate-acetate transporter protein